MLYSPVKESKKSAIPMSSRLLDAIPINNAINFELYVNSRAHIVFLIMFTNLIKYSVDTRSNCNF